MPAVTRRARRVPRTALRWVVVAAADAGAAARAVARGAVAERRAAAVADQGPDAVGQGLAAAGRAVVVAAVMAAPAAPVTDAAVDVVDRGRSVKAPIWSRTSSRSIASPRS